MTRNLFHSIARCCGLLAALFCSWPLAAQDSTAPGRQVDLELVLAVDSSSSVSAAEFDLQMKGLAAAFRNRSVLAAIQSTGDLGIAVSVVQWSDNRKQFVAVDWRHVFDIESAEIFAKEIDEAPRFLVGGGTALGGAIGFSMRQFGRNGFDGRRQVIDISGDGRTNQGAHPAQIRDAAVAAGITINGLAILNEDLYVDRYYQFNVIGGTGAFVMTASDYQDFATAMLEKLVKEISGVPVASLPTRTLAYPPLRGRSITRLVVSSGFRP